MAYWIMEIITGCVWRFSSKDTENIEVPFNSTNKLHYPIHEAQAEKMDIGCAWKVRKEKIN